MTDAPVSKAEKLARAMEDFMSSGRPFTRQLAAQIRDELRASDAECDALRKEWLETGRALQQRTLQAAKAEGERDALQAAIRSALCEYDHSREDAAEVRQEMGRILRAADNPKAK